MAEGAKAGEYVIDGGVAMMLDGLKRERRGAWWRLESGKYLPIRTGTPTSKKAAKEKTQ